MGCKAAHACLCCLHRLGFISTMWDVKCLFKITSIIEVLGFISTMWDVKDNPYLGSLLFLEVLSRLCGM